MNNDAAFSLHAARLQEIGCLACRADGRPGVPADLHHPLRGYRMGQYIVLPLCPHHHRGLCEGSPADAEAKYGPSRALNKKAFVQRYGTDLKLLAMLEGLLEAKA